MKPLVAGSRFGFRAVGGLRATHTWIATPAAPAPPWRALDHAVARWVMAHGGSSLLAEVAAWASFAEGQGDSALLLRGDTRHGMEALDAKAIGELQQQPLLGRADEAVSSTDTPFVLDGEHCYLRRNFRHEVAVAQHLHARRRQATSPGLALDDVQLRALFNGGLGEAEAAQRLAVSVALGKRLFVLTGGPGTGKTTTVLRMLLALCREHAASHARPPLIRLAAPTGKAAQRLAESLREGGRRLQERLDQAAPDWQPLPSEWIPDLHSVLDAPSSTLHRLLGSRGRHGGFSHHRDNPIAADIVVVDEASMLDLALLRALLEALREDSLLVLVGDADQLTSVGTGSVLLDIVAAMQEQHATELVRLRHCFRSDMALVPVNEAVQRGDVEAFQQACDAAGTQRVRRREAGNTRQLAGLLAEWCKRLHDSLALHGALHAIEHDDLSAVQRAFAGLRQQQLLCALREGEFGAEQANALIERGLRAEFDAYADQVWYPGRAVMITRNDYASDLLNGDVGLCLMQQDAQGGSRLTVWFESAPGSTTRYRALAPDNLPPHQGGFALTVHKSQGSEFGRVAVLLPPDEASPMLSRQLLYTALSRARDSVELWGSENAIRQAIAQSSTRAGRLTQRLMLP